MSTIYNIADFLVTIVFNVYVYCLVIRLILQYLHAPWHNPLTQFILKITDPVVKPLQKLIPGFRGIDFAILTLAFLLTLIQLWILVWLRFHALPGMLGMLIATVGQIGVKFMYIFMWSVILVALASWFPRLQGSPLLSILHRINYPLTAPLRKIMPTFSGVDFSPIVTILVLWLIIWVVFHNLILLGFRVAFS